MITVRRFGAWVAVCASLLSSGCYAYYPARVEDARPQQSVRVRLAPSEAQRLSEYADPHSRTLNGKVVEVSEDSLLVLVPSHTELRGVRVETLFQRIQVGRDGILEVEARSLDRPRTYLVTGLAFAAVAAFTINQLSGDGGSPVVPPGGGPADSVLPGLSIPFRIWSLFGR